MRKRVLLLTGSPGVGKTTVLMETVKILREKGLRVGGMVSREVRENGTRVGFELLDLRSQNRGWLAHVNQEKGPRLGKYRVNLKDLDAIGSAALIEALHDCDVVAVDEIGPMELFSESFREAVRRVLESRKLVIAIVHWKAQDRLINDARNMAEAETITVTTENRESLSQTLAEKALNATKARNH